MYMDVYTCINGYRLREYQNNTKQEAGSGMTERRGSCDEDSVGMIIVTFLTSQGQTASQKGSHRI